MQEHRATLRVRDAMTPQVECGHLHEPLQTAAERMGVRNVNALAVLDGDKLVGMITSNDIFHRAVSAGIDLRKAQVHAFLSTAIVSCQDDHTLKEAAVIMEGAHVRHLPVLNHENALVGMLSVEDLAKHGFEKEAGRVLKCTGRESNEAKLSHAPKSYSTKPKLKG